MKKISLSVLLVLSVIHLANAKETKVGDTTVKSNKDGTTTITVKDSLVKEHTKETHDEAVKRVTQEKINRGQK